MPPTSVRAAARGVLLLFLLGPLARTGANAAGLAVVPVAAPPGPAGQEAAGLRALSAELALRCPSARVVPFAALAPLLPRFEQGAGATAVSVPVSAPPELARLRAAFFAGEDPAGLAVQLTRLVRELEADPVALLNSPRRRAALRETYLLAARAHLQARQEDAARSLLSRLLVRLPDLPPADPAEWGPALQQQEQQLRRAPPAAALPLFVDGPAGWAVHLDEQPAGALPDLLLRAPPGPHAVVVVGTDGTRASWLLELPGGLPPRLIADRRLVEVCDVGGSAGLCSPSPDAEARPAGAAALGRLLDSELLLLRRAGNAIVARRLGAGPEEGASAPAPGAPVPVEKAATLLAGRLCRQRAAAAPAAPAAAKGRVPAMTAVRQRRALRRLPVWPAALLLSAGLLLSVGSAPYFVYDGRCVDSDCVKAYDFHAVAPGLLSAGAALTLGGALWLGFALR